MFIVENLGNTDKPKDKRTTHNLTSGEKHTLKALNEHPSKHFL